MDQLSQRVHSSRGAVRVGQNQCEEEAVGRVTRASTATLVADLRSLLELQRREDEALSGLQAVLEDNAQRNGRREGINSGEEWFRSERR